VQGLVQDLRYGSRMFARNPGVTAVMILTLGLAIGANTAIFSVVYGVLLRPLPYPKPDQLVSISEVAADGHLMNFADPNVADLRAANHSLTGMAKAYDDEETVSGGSGPARVSVGMVSRDFFDVMGIDPVLGRKFSADELKESGIPAALVSYGYWKEHLNGSSDLTPFKLKMADHAFSVVGVLPPSFNYPERVQIWVAAELFGDQSPSRTSHNWPVVVGRLRNGITLPQARAELSTIARRLHEQYKPNIDMTDVSIQPLRTALTVSVRSTLLILLGAVAFLLLVGCVNVANLLLARAASRQRELAVRAALGADRGRLVRQFLIESLLLSLSGGVIGVLAAIWGVDALLVIAPAGLPRLNDVSVSLPVLAFALGVSLVVACGLGVLTALRASSADAQQALNEGGWAQLGSLRTQRLGRVLVAAQLAITLVLLTGAGLLGRSLLRVLSVDPGFRTSHIVTMELEVPASQAATMSNIAEVLKDARPGSFMNALFERLRALPGVEEVGGVSSLPLGETGSCPDGGFLFLDRQPQLDVGKPEDIARLEHLFLTTPGGLGDYCVASRGYFKALGIPLLQGRLFDEHDTANAAHVAVISQSLARATWPNQNPIGRTIEFGNMDGDMRLLTVVGIVGDAHYRSLEKPPEPTVYVDYTQRLRGGRDFTVVMRSAAPPQTLLADARRILRELDPDVAPRFQSFQDVFSDSVATRRFNLTLMAVFAAAALILAAVGLYGVMAYWVSRRTREIGVRMALGAVPGRVLELVLGRAAITIAVGLAAGIAGALILTFLLTRFVQSLLFGVSADDPVTFAGVALLLAAVAMLATYIPARRAAKVDPMVALRCE